ncbi:hypothetical protein PBRA_009706 [Plasmodiophora brassicae]|uniref:Uncharacterized protein n=1 Tax=Plasmodiophora brassicae TaxID=37360 RepID=A0A0G4ILD1_PLABS|nr:hypothetical protein PBRA_009706 [Plasmodiophora brassicae]
MASEATSSTDEHIGVKDADASILPQVAKLDSTSILKLKEQYDRYCAVVIDREGNRPEAARIKPQAIRFCFTTPQPTCIALNHLFLNNVDLLTDDNLEGWIDRRSLPASHGLTTQDIEAKIANELSMDTSLPTLRDQVGSILDRMTGIQWRRGWQHMRETVGDFTRQWVKEDKSKREGDLKAIMKQMQEWITPKAAVNGSAQIGGVSKKTCAELRLNDRSHKYQVVITVR